MTDEFHARFRNVVVKGRPSVDSANETIFDGRVFTARQAQELHLVDQIGYLDNAVAAAQKWLESIMQMLFSIIAKMTRRCRRTQSRPTRHCKKGSSQSMCLASTVRSCLASSICGRWSPPPKPHYQSSCSMKSMRQSRVFGAWWIVVPLLLIAAHTNHCPAANAIYDALVGQGIKASPQETLQLPKPAMEDGLQSAQQKQLIGALLAGKHDWDNFTRKSVVSPFILKISEGSTESGPIVRHVDIYFVAFGSFDSLKSEDYLNKQLNLAVSNDQSDASGRAKMLAAEELRKRNITAGTKPDDPRWVAVTSTLLGKVRISLTTQNIKTEGNDSILIASVADPRFATDAEYPNCWRPVTVDDSGKHRRVQPNPTSASVPMQRRPSSQCPQARSSWNTTSPLSSPKAGSMARTYCDPNCQS